MRRLPEVKAAAPVVESVLELAGPHQGPVLLLGIDPFSEGAFRDYEFSRASDLSDAALARFSHPARRASWSADPWRRACTSRPAIPCRWWWGARKRRLRVAGVFQLPQRPLSPGRGGACSWISARPRNSWTGWGAWTISISWPTGDEARLPDALKAVLPPGVEVVRPAAQGSQTEGLVASYRLNLAVLSAIALFVGMFLIYQSVTLSVVRRRREIGLLRTLGMTPGQVLVLFLAEGLASGLVGGLIGPGSGGGPGPGRPGGDDPEPHLPLYAGGGRRRSWSRGGLLLQAWGLAVAATLAAAAAAGPGGGPHPGPGRVVPGGTGREAREPGPGLIFGWGLVALILAGVGGLLEDGRRPPLARVCGRLSHSAGLRPASPRWPPGCWAGGCSRLLRRLLGPAGDLGCRYLAGSLSRSAVSIAALACALGMLIAVTVMIGSFRRTVNDWVSRSISGDIFFGPAVFSTAAYDQFLPPEIAAGAAPGPGDRRHLSLPLRAPALSGTATSWSSAAASRCWPATAASGSGRGTPRRLWEG